MLYYAQHHPFGSVKVEGARFDFRKAIEEKEALLDQVRQANYRDILEGQEHVTWFEGRGRFVSPNEVQVDGEVIQGERFIVATGSSTRIIPFEGIDEVHYLTNREILRLRDLPESLIVIGAGPLGLEFAQMFSHFGSQVTVIEVAKRILPGADAVISEALRRCLEGEGIEIYTEVRTRHLREEGGFKIVEAEVDGIPREFKAKELLMATGVVGNVMDIGLEQAGVEAVGGAYIQVDEHYRTPRSACLLQADRQAPGRHDLDEFHEYVGKIPFVLFVHS